MTVSNQDNQYIIKKLELTIEYINDGQPFHDGNLKIYSHTVLWQSGQVDKRNLGEVHLAMDCKQRGMISNDSLRCFSFSN